MPASFSFPQRTVKLWVPLQLTEQIYAERDNQYLYVLGRLRKGVTIDAGARRDAHHRRRARAHLSREQAASA